MEALNNYIIVKKDRSGYTTKSGIYIPGFAASREPAASPPYTGVVASVGPCATLNVKEGDRVVYNDLSNPYWVERGEEILIAVLETEIAAVMEETA
jgi:co-chaperonin GroES (HSP10)